MVSEQDFGLKHLENDDIRIIIPLEPFTKKNSQKIINRRTRDGRTVPVITPSDNYKKYARSAMWYLKPVGIDYPVNVKAYYYMPSRRTVDLTNLHEALHDILVVGGVIKDDNCSIIVSTDGSRVYYDKENPRTEVTISREKITFIKES